MKSGGGISFDGKAGVVRVRSFQERRRGGGSYARIDQLGRFLCCVGGWEGGGVCEMMPGAVLAPRD